jgi:hypothetical protein
MAPALPGWSSALGSIKSNASTVEDATRWGATKAHGTLLSSFCFLQSTAYNVKTTVGKRVSAPELSPALLSPQAENAGPAANSPALLSPAHAGKVAVKSSCKMPPVSLTDSQASHKAPSSKGLPVQEDITSANLPSKAVVGSPSPLDDATSCRTKSLAGLAKSAARVGTGALAVQAGAQAGIPLALGWAGFSSLGPVAGSSAAGWMSSVAVANGGGVAAGSLYAWCQSAAMGGTAVLGAPVAIGVTVGGYGTFKAAKWGWAKLKRGERSKEQGGTGAALC